MFRDYLFAYLNCPSSDFAYYGARNLDGVTLLPVHSYCGQLSHDPRSAFGSQTSLFICVLLFVATVAELGTYCMYMASGGVISPCLCCLSKRFLSTVICYAYL